MKNRIAMLAATIRIDVHMNESKAGLGVPPSL